MSPASHSAPPTLGLLGLLSLLLLLLLLCLPAARGDCSTPPDVPNATPVLNNQANFPVDKTVMYKCNEGFVKIPGKSDSVTCLQTNEWSKLSEFCNRTCSVPPSLRFASLKKVHGKQNYFPAGSVVEYECRPGYKRNSSLPAKLTCREDLVWSTAPEFCTRRSCPVPADLLHGKVHIANDILLGSVITFSCNTGYRLVGEEESHCTLVDKNVVWSDPHPECTEILCGEPPKIANGEIQGSQKIYKYGSSVTYTCIKDFSLIGEKSIHCTVKDEQGEWSGPPPECKDVKCKKLVVQNGHIVSPSKPPYKYQHTLTFDCNPGFILMGNSTIHCGPESKWIPGIPSCKAALIGPTAVAPTTVKKSTIPKTPAIQTQPATQQANPTHAPATQTPPATQQVNPTHAPATQIPPAIQQANLTHAPATQTLPATQQVNTTDAPTTETLPATQQVNPTDAPATQAPPAIQHFSTTHAPTTETLPATQQVNTTHVLATQILPATQNGNTTDAPATQAPPATEKVNTTSAPATQAPPETEKVNTTNDPATQTPPTTQQTSTTKATTSAPATTRRSITTTQRSTRIVTTLRPFHTTRPSLTKVKETTPSGAVTVTYGIGGGLIVLAGLIILPVFIKLLYYYGKSGSYDIHEINKELNVLS